MSQLRRRAGVALVLTVLLAVAAACGTDDLSTDEARERAEQAGARAEDAAKDVQDKAQGATGAGERKLAIRAPSEGSSVKGNVVTLQLDVGGVRIVKADGDTSGTTGHFHVLVDQEPPAVGQPIPRTAGIIHTTDNPVKIHGLPVGRHRITVVVGDGNHVRLPDLAAATAVNVEGPSVDATAPATVPAGQPVRVDLKAEGVQIVRADGSPSFASGHYHVFVDRDPTPPGQTVPPQPEDRSIIHTAEALVELPPLTPGEHTIWVVLGNGAHTVFDPPVQDKLTVTVTSS